MEGGAQFVAVTSVPLSQLPHRIVGTMLPAQPLVLATDNNAVP
jgi:hypothetical protein